MELGLDRTTSHRVSEAGSNNGGARAPGRAEMRPTRGQEVLEEEPTEGTNIEVAGKPKNTIQAKGPQPLPTGIHMTGELKGKTDATKKEEPTKQQLNERSAT